MSLIKNSYGVSIVIPSARSDYNKLGTFAGSCLNRVTPKKKLQDEDENDDSEIKAAPKRKIKNEDKEIKPRSMSQRTKSKIRKKIIALAQIQKKMSFLTLTFCNQVDDKVAVKVLASFLNNVNKLTKDFQYLWVAEKQTKNTVFKNNIHFHLITNQYWKIQKWWKYWLDLQAKYGIVPVSDKYKPSSAFDVKKINSGKIKNVCNYLTKYVVKNNSQFNCQVWNCSKKISRLYTDFYSGMAFIRQLEKLEEQKLLGGDIKTYKEEWCDIKLIPLNHSTLPFYTPIDKENRHNWKNYETLEKLKEKKDEKQTI